MVSESQSTLKTIEKFFLAAAKRARVAPKDLRRTHLRAEREESGKKWIAERQINNLGGFVHVRDLLFGKSDSGAKTTKKTEQPPKPPNPLASEEASNLIGHELSAYIAKVIGACAAERNIPPHELTWDEFRKFINFKWGTNNAGIARHNITRAGGFNAIRDAYFPVLPTKVTTEKKRLFQQANMNRRLGDEYAKQKFIMESLEDFTTRIFPSGQIQVKSYLSRTKMSPTKRCLTALLTDWHVGSDIKPEETGHAFGRVEEARRAAHVFREIAEFKRQYRKETELHAILGGDMIQNQLHDSRDGAVLSEQMSRCIHILIQGLAFLSTQFGKITVHCTTGNHGRFKSRHESRAIHEKWDSAETEIYYAVKSALRHIKEISFNIPRTPFVTFSTFGQKTFATHGDGVFMPGNPSKTIPMAQLEMQANKINAGLTDTEEYSVFAVGHVHKANIAYLDNGAAMITNGALVPPDPYAISLGITETQCGQFIWESVEGFPVGDNRLIRLSSAVDRDSSLDEIIQPWSDFND